MLTNSILLHIPHSGTIVPHDLCMRLTDSGKMYDATLEIMAYSRPLIDYYTDELFAQRANTPRVRSLVFPYNRAVCDVERLPHDPLEAKGLGIVSACGRPDWAEQNAVYRQRALIHYIRHHHDLENLLYEMSVQSDYKPLLLDCHSFSARPNALCQDERVRDVDICIGVNDDASRPSEEFIEGTLMFFRNKGYRAELNFPFSNSKTIDTPVDCHSLMIEVNKTLYMDEETLAKTAGFSRLQADLQEFCDRAVRQMI